MMATLTDAERLLAFIGILNVALPLLQGDVNSESCHHRDQIVTNCGD